MEPRQALIITDTLGARPAALHPFRQWGALRRSGSLRPLEARGLAAQARHRDRAHCPRKAPAERPARAHALHPEAGDAWPAANSRAQQARFDAFLADFNGVRPQEALDMQALARAYAPLPRPFAGLRGLAYSLHDLPLVATGDGAIGLHGRQVVISSVFAGQRLGLREVHTGVRLVSFMRDELGYIDLEARTLQTIKPRSAPGFRPCDRRNLQPVSSDRTNVRSSILEPDPKVPEARLPWAGSQFSSGPDALERPIGGLIAARSPREASPRTGAPGLLGQALKHKMYYKINIARAAYWLPPWSPFRSSRRGDGAWRGGIRPLRISPAKSCMALTAAGRGSARSAPSPRLWVSRRSGQSGTPRLSVATDRGAALLRLIL